ncbi:MAG: PIN domain-containing protein [Dehalococcoidia bacterium]|nr:PIN domain-containing protein [Dehalococcoidia bacterium]
MTIRRPACLIDTNILVYAFDPSALEKQSRGLALLRALEADMNGVLTVQVLGEFFRVVTQRITVPLVRPEAQEIVHDLATSFTVLETTVAAILEAARSAHGYSLSFWDGVIWATAKQNGVGYLLSEDMQTGRTIAGVQILNPLETAFDLANLR